MDVQTHIHNSPNRIMEEFTHEFFENASKEWRRNKQEITGCPGMYRYRDSSMNRVEVSRDTPLKPGLESTLKPSLRRSQRIANRKSKE
jgi:hypothetical protein